MFDISQEIYRYKPVELKDIMQSSRGIDPDHMEEAVKLYNQAIKRLQSKSEDIAIIELKKALSYYPDMIEAKVLLSLAYIMGQQYNPAEQMLKSIIDSDTFIVRAYVYLRYITKNSKQKSVHITQKVINIELPKVSFSGTAGVIKMIAFITVGIIMACLYFWIFNSASYKNEDKLTQQPIADNTMNTGVVKLEEDLKALQQKFDENNDELVYLKNVKQLLIIESYMENGKIDEAKNILESLKNFKFEETDYAKYLSLSERLNKQKVNKSTESNHVESSSQLYKKGYDLYNQGKYQEALSYLNEYVKLGQTGSTTQYAWYLAGKSYQAMDDKANAAICYNRAINDFPDSKYTQYAKNRLNELNR